MLFVHKWSTPKAHSLGNVPSGIYPEAYFHHILSCERKRTERSHRPFLLMLADIPALTEGNSTDYELNRRVIDAITAGSRDIDFKGWYVDQKIIGVIFTELNGTDLSTAMQQISDRIWTSFRQYLSKDECSTLDVSFHVYPESAAADQPCTESNHILYPDIQKRHTQRRVDLMMKRLLDIVGSIVAIILFSPVMLLIALAIKLTSPGPVLFRQERIGQYGKPFTFLKFRSMKVNNDCSIHKSYVEKLIQGKIAEPQPCGMYKIVHDPRVTPIGRFIRKTSLDELPQFFNVLMGQMSIVGPRPPIPYELEKYDIWHRRRILSMKPGITGLWQVFGRSRTTFDEMVRLDIRYTRQWSIWMDIQLILATPWVVLTGKGGC